MPRPPEPLDGLVSIAEFGNKLQADVALSALQAEGFEATLVFDPALNTVATYFASDRTVELVVKAEDVEAAVATLEHLTTDLPEEFSDEHASGHRSSGRRRTLRRVGLLVLLIWLFVPIVVAVVVAALSEW